MIYIIIAVICSVIVSINFKLFKRFSKFAGMGFVLALVAIIILNLPNAV
ncbi:MAG TPA: hypothetical protein VFM79_03105 [Pelobium sp.]|nr:hypothetical protein [Pelobium sp.]